VETRYDAIIIGGGPSGSTTAILLAQAGWHVAVVEKSVFPRRKVCGEFISATTWSLLRQLGVAVPLLEIAGPAVHRVGIYAGDAMIAAPIASLDEPLCDHGRAAGREHLDALLLKRAASAGATVWQPCTLLALDSLGGDYDCTILEKGTRRPRTLRSRLIVAAHGSWESGPMPTQTLRKPPSASDLFGFKAHFHGSSLPTDLMPLLAFPGGYGGMVHSDGGRVSLSCCVRRDQLEHCRQRATNQPAGAAVFAHIASSCRGVALALDTATPSGVWLSSGPLRTGIHSFGRGGIFAVGNAAAEAHPVIAEGISMAIQSAALLCAQLLARQDVRGEAPSAGESMLAIRRAYTASWRRNFSRRLHLAALFANLFMRPASTRIAVATLRRFPQLLTDGSGWSGKTEPLRSLQPYDMARP